MGATNLCPRLLHNRLRGLAFHLISKQAFAANGYYGTLTFGLPVCSSDYGRATFYLQLHRDIRISWTGCVCGQVYSGMVLSKQHRYFFETQYEKPGKQRPAERPTR